MGFNGSEPTESAGEQRAAGLYVQRTTHWSEGETWWKFDLFPSLKLELTMKFPRWLLAQLYFIHYLSIYSWISHSKIMPFQRPKNFLPYAIFPVLFIVLTFIWSAAVIQKECSHTPVDFIILWKTMTLCRRHPPSFCRSPWRAIIIKVCLDSFWHTVSPNKLGGGTVWSGWHKILPTVSC